MSSYQETILSKIIKTSRSYTTTSYTHVLLDNPWGKIDVSDKISKFWAYYLECARLKLPLSIAENPGLETPVRVDIDLRAKKGEFTGSIYTIDNVLTVIRAYQTALSESLVGLSEEALMCVLLEKDPKDVEIKGIMYTKHGFHLHFPKLFMENLNQQAYIIPKTQDSLHGLFNHLRSNDATADYEFIDDNVCKVHWLLYGSSKLSNEPYVVTRCFDSNLREISLTEALGDYDISKFRGEEKINLENDEKKIRYFLPRILSTALYDRTQYYYRCKQRVVTPIVDRCEQLKRDRPDFTNENIAAVVAEARSLLKLLNDERANNRKNWLSIGFTLHNITAGDNDGLDLWLEFSARSPKYNEYECLNIWSKMRQGRHTIGTLKYFAKRYNLEAYEALNRKRTVRR